MSEHPIIAVIEALRRFGDRRTLPSASAYLRRQAAAIHAELKDTVLAEVPAFTESHDPATLRELAIHGPQHRERRRALPSRQIRAALTRRFPPS